MKAYFRVTYATKADVKQAEERLLHVRLSYEANLARRRWFRSLAERRERRALGEEIRPTNMKVGPSRFIYDGPLPSDLRHEARACQQFLESMEDAS